MQYDNMIMPDRARKAAEILKQYCIQSGCVYCCFKERTQNGAELCGLCHRVPRDYPEFKTEKGGMHYA